MANFYLIETLEASPGGTITIIGDEARHIATVARTRVGQPLRLGNGQGLCADTVVQTVSPREVQCRVERAWLVPPPPFRIHLAQALAKGDRDELAIQAATELGVDGVIPWQAERSVARWSGEKIQRGMRRWQTIMREATKQSMRAWIPELFGLADTTTLVTGAVERGERIIVLEPGAEHSLPELLPTLRAELVDTAAGAGSAAIGAGAAAATVEATDTGVGAIDAAFGAGDGVAPDATGTAANRRPTLLLVVGPEGGITPTEIQQFHTAGACTATLGPNVLRTSTAGPAALAVLGAALGRWTATAAPG